MSFRRNAAHPNFIIGTTAELIARTEPLNALEIAINEDDGTSVAGPGMYSALVAARNVGADLSVRVATTANITIASGLNAGDTIDGVELEAGDVVLVKNQSTESQNGIYVVGSSPARHTDDADYDNHVRKLVYIREGTQAGQLWRNINASGGTIGSTAINWEVKVFQALNLGVSNQNAYLGAKTTGFTGDETVMIEDPAAGGAKRAVELSDLKTYMNA